MNTIVILATILVWFAKTARCCGGNKLQIEYIRDCDPNNVVRLSENFSVVMKDNCDVFILGCVTSLSNITSSQIDYNVQKDTIKRSGKKNGCSQLESKQADVEAALEKLGLPKRCPIKKGTVCFPNKSINLSKYKLTMSMLAGNIKGKALITTDGGKSCMEFSAKLVNGLVRTAGLGVIG